MGIGKEKIKQIKRNLPWLAVAVFIIISLVGCNSYTYSQAQDTSISSTLDTVQTSAVFGEEMPDPRLMEVPPGNIIPENTLKVNVKDYGAKGDGVADDVNAINSAIDFVNRSGGGVVFFPAAHYRATRFGFFNCHNVTLLLSPGTVLQIMDKKPVEKYQPFIRFTDGSTNCHIIAYGAEIKRNKSMYTLSEYRHAVVFNRCSNCSVQGGKISDSGGDGVYLENLGSEGYPREILIKDVWLDNHRRQGISIISGSNIKISNVLVSNTNGSQPGAAIDIEPNEDHYVYTVSVNKLVSENNRGPALKIYLFRGPDDISTQLDVSGLESYSDKHAFLCGGTKDSQKLSVNIQNLYGEKHRSAGIGLYELGDKTTINIQGKVNSSNRPAVGIQYWEPENDLIKERPEINIDLATLGTGDTIYCEGEFPRLIKMSRNMYFRIRNQETNRLSNFDGLLVKVDADLVSYKHIIKDSFLGPSDTMQGTCIVTNKGAELQSLLTLDDTEYKPGSMVTIEAQSKHGIKIGSISNKILPFGNNLIKTGQAGARITLEKVENGDWQVVGSTGTWEGDANIYW